MKAFAFLFLIAALAGSVQAATLFESNWSTATGTDITTALRDGGRWNFFTCSSGIAQVMAVIPGSSVGWTATPNVMQFTQRGPSYCGNVETQNTIPQLTDFYARMYIRNDDTSFGWHDVTLNCCGSIQAAIWSRNPWNATHDRFAVQGPVSAYPFSRWISPPTPKGQWYRWEWYVEYLNTTNARIWTRAYDMAGNLVIDENNIRNVDTFQQTLAQRYAAGYTITVGDANLFRRFGTGNPGQAMSPDNGLHWYQAAVKIVDVPYNGTVWVGPVDATPPPDTTPPSASITAPTANQVLVAGTTQTTLNVTTNEAATCRWSTSDQTYASMPNTFTTTGSTAHSTNLTNLTNGQSYTRYVRCQDTASNPMTASQSRTFSIANPAQGAAAYETDFETGTKVNTATWTWATIANPTITNEHSNSGSYSMRFLYAGGANCTDSTSEQRFTLGTQVSEVWMEYYVYFPDGTEGFANRYEHRDQWNPICPVGGATNNKWFRIWGQDYGDCSEMGSSTWAIAGGDSRWYSEIFRNNGASCDPMGSYNTGNVEPFIDDTVRGRWVRIRQHYKLGTTGMSNGVNELWVDDTKVFSNTALDTNSGVGYWDQGYIFGWANSGFNLDTKIYLDDFKYYNSDPEWDNEPPADSTPPTAAITAPTANQVLVAGTTQTTLNVTTNEAATCRWSTTDQTYASMPNTFTTTGNTAHSTNLTNLTNGQSYTRYVRCQDTAGNPMTASQSRTFSVANPGAVCGNGVLEAGETCDQGASNGACPASCSLSCTTNTCVTPNAADVNQDGVVDLLDIVTAVNDRNTVFNSRSDLNSDGVINIFDLVLIVTFWGQTS